LPAATPQQQSTAAAPPPVAAAASSSAIKISNEDGAVNVTSQHKLRGGIFRPR